MKTLSFLAACREFFGVREGQTAIQFAAEVRQLTPEDRAELAPLLARALGCEVTV